MFFGCTPPDNLLHHHLTSKAWCENVSELTEVLCAAHNEHSTVLLELSGVEAQYSRVAGRCHPSYQGCLDVVAPIDLT